MVPKSLCLQAFCHGNWNRTLDRQWGSVWQFLHPRDVTQWGWSTSATWNTLRRHPTYTTPDMAHWTGSALRELYFSLLSGPGTCDCHTATSPPLAGTHQMPSWRRTRLESAERATPPFIDGP
jgi:hypothetical protein